MKKYLKERERKKFSFSFPPEAFFLSFNLTSFFLSLGKYCNLSEKIEMTLWRGLMVE